MARSLISMLALGAFALAGCGVGNGADDDQLPPEDANEESILCTATVALSGTFTAAAALDPLAGCQPEGTWAVTVTVSSKGTCATVPVKASYRYTLTGTGHNTQVTYAKATGEEFQGNVSAGGSGQCSGFFEHIQPDGANFDLIALHPLLPKPTTAVLDLPISGSGDFELWKRHP